MPQMAQMPDLPSLSSQQPAMSSQQPAVTAQQPATGGQQQRNTPFTVDQLIGAWVGLKNTFKKEQRLVAMLDTYRPTLIDEHTVQVTFVNPWQQEEFKKFGKQIADLLRDKLQNDLLQIRVTVAEQAATRRAYTSEEKYRVLHEQNPYLGEFKKRFDMLLE